MATEAQIQANRLNALKSTGPRTVEGKAAVAQNALKHGLWARQAVIAGEDVGAFEYHRDRMLAELAPEGEMESMLAQRVVGLAWRLLRAERLQNEAFDALYEKDTTGPLARLTESLRAKERAQFGGNEERRELACGRVVVRDFSSNRVLDRLLMYERRLEHSLYKTMTELQRLRLLRESDALPTAPERGEPPASPRRAKQSQSAATPTKAKCPDRKDVAEDVAPPAPPKQSQTKPIEMPAGGGRPETGGFQVMGEAVYSTPSSARCDVERSASAVVVLGQGRKESS